VDYQPKAGGRVLTPFELRDDRQSRFHAEPTRGAEYKIQLRNRPDANHTARLVALAKKQLALIAENGFHSFSFRLWLKFRSQACVLDDF
jgi:hypothetical protein